MFILSVGGHPFSCFLRISGMPGILVPVCGDIPTHCRRKSTGNPQNTTETSCRDIAGLAGCKTASMCCAG
ncbi:hypothetical protein P6U16_20960 [Rhizobium sp. 32-5/1]|uniref:hypothetical protein n=1 Tax=Rhizobium sp. 32-5/1 TaxID=3019602 RepID=UPI00240E8B1B|nr:hypothetical protein [Rhizobium sp. 32-5/1]WEZ83274.1 hypothetical protein P6U16_20960 [Rhizobium sp. 32-5/1]